MFSKSCFSLPLTFQCPESVSEFGSGIHLLFCSLIEMNSALRLQKPEKQFGACHETSPPDEMCSSYITKCNTLQDAKKIIKIQVGQLLLKKFM